MGDMLSHNAIDLGGTTLDTTLYLTSYLDPQISAVAPQPRGSLSGDSLGCALDARKSASKLLPRATENRFAVL